MFATLQYLTLIVSGKSCFYLNQADCTLVIWLMHLGKGIWFFTTRGQESPPPASNLDGSRSLFLDEKTSVWTQELIWTNNRNRACSVQINDNVIGVHHLLLILELRNGLHDPQKDT